MPTAALLPDSSFWRGKKVFLTGHTGFKGAWLTLWLDALGAKVAGYSLPPESTPNIFDTLDVAKRCEKSHIADIRDAAKLDAAIKAFKPDIVIHMAAQPLVRRSYREPLSTIATNIDGTAHVLEACRTTEGVRAALIITTDKCYKNKETSQAYGEDDELGGRDIYSASKACAEIITHAYRQSFFDEKHPALVATARAGNVIGGGDWSEDRLIPDAVRAFSEKRTLDIRSPQSVRPWQHIAEPLLGYLMLARAMFERNTPVSSAYNFGPGADAIVPVQRVVEAFSSQWEPAGQWRATPPAQALHEAGLLVLDSARARQELGWHPCFDLDNAVAHTADWYRHYYMKATPASLADRMLSVFDTVVTQLAEETSFRKKAV